MNITYPCFACGSTDHIKANCPKRTPSAKTPPGTRLEAAPEEEKIKTEHCLKCGSKGAHHPTCGQPASTPERIAEIIASIGINRNAREERCRLLAAEQAAEARADRTVASAA